MLDNIGEVLKIARIASDKCKKDVQEETGLSSSYISDIERGRRKGISLETIKKLAKVYSFEASQILELLEYYNSLDGKSKYQKYVKTLIEALKMLDENLS